MNNLTCSADSYLLPGLWKSKLNLKFRKLAVVLCRVNHKTCNDNPLESKLIYFKDDIQSLPWCPSENHLLFVYPKSRFRWLRSLFNHIHKALPEPGPSWLWPNKSLLYSMPIWIHVGYQKHIIRTYVTSSIKQRTLVEGGGKPEWTQQRTQKVVEV